MARIAGVNIRDKQHVCIALTDIYGIGRSAARTICKKLGIDGTIKVMNLTDAQLESIRQYITAHHTVEGDKRREVAMNIKRLTDMGCYRGLRHRRGLPVRGQRTKTNARTRKGKAKSIRK